MGIKTNDTRKKEELQDSKEEHDKETDISPSIICKIRVTRHPLIENIDELGCQHHTFVGLRYNLFIQNDTRLFLNVLSVVWSDWGQICSRKRY